MINLLPATMLANVRVGLSASPSPDLARLGLLEEHFRLALGELGRTVLVLGGGLQYCGHLEPDGYTMFLVDELQRYGRKNDPLSVVLAWSVHRRLSRGELRVAQNTLGLFGTITYLSSDGTPTDAASGRGETAPGVPDDEVAPSLTAMRRTAIAGTQGRVFVGGRRSGFQGVMPGVLEEALMALAAGQPIFLAGGFGGVTLDIVREVAPSAADWFPQSPARDADELLAGLQQIKALVDGREWAAVGNGLNAAENTQLAATHRPSEIATLVSLGLGRLAESGTFSR